MIHRIDQFYYIWTSDCVGSTRAYMINHFMNTYIPKITKLPVREFIEL